MAEDDRKIIIKTDTMIKNFVKRLLLIIINFKCSFHNNVSTKPVIYNQAG